MASITAGFFHEANTLLSTTGRRNCIGESLAKMELFVFFVGLLQTFTFRPQPGISESDLDLTVPQTTFTLRPQPQATCAVLRE